MNLHEELKKKPLEEINRRARALFEDWKRIERQHEKVAAPK